MLRAGYLLLCLAAATYSKPSEKLKIIDFAVPSAVRMGENAELQCRYEAGQPESPLFYVKWWWTPLRAGADQRHQIYQRLGNTRPEAPHHETVKIKDNDTIELVNLQPKDSGVYECEVSDIDEEHRRHHDLIVYSGGSGPLLNTSRVADGPDADLDEDVSIECEASAVAPYPDLVIAIDGETVNTTASVNNHTDDSVFDIAVNVTVSRAAVDGREIRCELFYKDETITHEPFVVMETYDGSGGGGLPAVDEDATSLATEESLATESLQTDGGQGLSSSWVLLVVAAAAPARLLALL